jgi:hypothetical protein
MACLQLQAPCHGGRTPERIGSVSPISGGEYAWFRVVLLGLVGILAIMSLAGITILSAMQLPVPPVLAGALGASMGSITTLLTPVRVH